MNNFILMAASILSFSVLAAHAQTQSQAKDAFLSAAPAQLTKSETMCREQYVLIDQTYTMFRRGLSEQDAVRNQTNSSTTPKARAWVTAMVHGVFTDPRSMYVNSTATAFDHEQQCNRDPDKYRY